MKFAQDPMGQDGGLDRMLWNLHMMRYFQYVDVLEHIFNTGQGVVTERSPFSDWIYFDAAYNQGWIDKTTKQHYWKMRNLTIDRILRPNMIIHLDAPTDVVQSKIRARSATTHPWEKNSPVWQNSDISKKYTNPCLRTNICLQHPKAAMFFNMIGQRVATLRSLLRTWRGCRWITMISTTNSRKTGGCTPRMGSPPRGTCTQTRSP